MPDKAENIGLSADAAVEQAWFQAIYHHAAFGISLISPDNHYLGVDPAYERMMGYSAAELIGRPLLAITHPEDSEVSNKLNSRMDSGEIDEFTLNKCYLCRDSSEFFGRLKVSRVDDNDGRMLFKLAMVENINELKQREQALEDSEARLAEAQRIANMSNWEFVAENGTVYWSDGCYRIFGQDKSSFSPSHDSFLACVHPDDREKVKRVLHPEWRPHGRYSHEHRIVRPDGEVRHLQEWVVPFYDENGSVVRRVGAVQDITERKQAEEALR